MPKRFYEICHRPKRASSVSCLPWSQTDSSSSRINNNSSNKDIQPDSSLHTFRYSHRRTPTSTVSSADNSTFQPREDYYSISKDQVSISETFYTRNLQPWQNKLLLLGNMHAVDDSIAYFC